MIKPIIEEPLSTDKIKKSSLDLENKLNAICKGINILNKSVQANTFALLLTQKDKAKFNLIRKVKDGTVTPYDYGEFLESLSLISYYIMLKRFDYAEHDFLCEILVSGINTIKKYGGELDDCEDTPAMGVYNEIDKWRRS